MNPEPLPPPRPFRTSIETTAGLTRSAAAVTACEYGSRIAGAATPTKESDIPVPQTTLFRSRLRPRSDLLARSRRQRMRPFKRRRFAGVIDGDHHEMADRAQTALPGQQVLGEQLGLHDHRTAAARYDARHD